MDLRTVVAPLAQVSGWVFLLGVSVLGLVWLVGLVVALRGTAPPDRARIIDAYGRAFPGQRCRAPEGSARGRRPR